MSLPALLGPRIGRSISPIVTIFIAGALLALATAQRAPARDVPYVPTPQHVVDKMLEMGQVGPEDFIIDLGSGDGRIPITAAQRHGTRGLGVDIDPVRITEANVNAEKAKVTDKVEFREEDLFKTDLSKATVLTLYLLPEVNIKLRPRILEQLKPGARVVSHSFHMGDWAPDRVEEIDGRKIHLWIIPATLKGRWQVTEEGGRNFALKLKQNFQHLEGTANIDGRDVPLSNTRVDGDRISFDMALDKEAPKRFEGRVNANRIEGDRWQATRG